jgi:hypothetical protein
MIALMATSAASSKGYLYAPVLIDGKDMLLKSFSAAILRLSV